MSKANANLLWGMVLWLGLAGTSSGARMFNHALMPEGPEPTGWKYVPTSDETEIILASKKKLFLQGRYDVRLELWGDYSLFYNSSPHWKVLNIGEKHGWWFHVHKFAASSRGSGSAMSPDGRICFAWLDIEKQLTAIDVASGLTVSLTELPTLAWNYKSDERLDPAPVWRDNGVVYDTERFRVLFVLQEQYDEDVFFWQRRKNRGGYQIVEVSLLEEGGINALSGPQKMPGYAIHWELSLKREEVYVVVCRQAEEPERFEYTVEVRSFDGRLLRTLPEEITGSLWLSPDETRLLVQRRGGGFLIVDLETNETVDGPSSGHSPAWSPDGDRIAYLDRWDLWLYHITDKKSERIAYREPVGSSSADSGPLYYKRPTWSPDGNMVAANIGGGHSEELGHLDAPTLIVDFKRRLAMAFPDYIDRISWIPDPKPFGSGASDGILSGQLVLRWQFHAGEKLRYRIEDTTRLGMGKHELKQHMALDTTWNVLRVENGIAETAVSIDRISFDALGEVFGEKVDVEYDSSTGKAKGTFVGSGVADLLNGVVGSSVILKIDPRGRVIEDQWPEKWGALFSARTERELAGFYGGHIAEPGFRRAVMLPLVAFPDGSVSVGQGWMQDHKHRMADRRMELSSHSTYSYKGDVERNGFSTSALETAITETLTVNPVGREPRTARGRYQGDVYFDHENGRLCEAIISTKPRVPKQALRWLTPPSSEQEYRIILLNDSTDSATDIETGKALPFVAQEKDRVESTEDAGASPP